jgi:hypothetical protein
VVGGVALCLLLNGTSALCQTTPAMEATRVASNGPAQATTEPHPLLPVIRWAEQERPKVAAIKDYTAILQKQENIGGVVQQPQIMDVKVRHQPFSAYTKFRFPRNLEGQQAIYVEGKNDSKLIGHGVGGQRIFGTQRLDPTGLLAMRGQKYPITDMGVLNLIDKLLEVGYKDSKYGECEVTYTEVELFKNTPSARVCTVIQVVHPVPRPNLFTFYLARIYVDKEMNIPIRYESYDWPRKAGESPMLIEVYTYMDLKINVGLTDLDFDHTNPAYAFP